MYLFLLRQANFEETTDKDIKEDATAKGARQASERGRSEETRRGRGEKKERRRNQKNQGPLKSRRAVQSIYEASWRKEEIEKQGKKFIMFFRCYICDSGVISGFMPLLALCPSYPWPP